MSSTIFYKFIHQKSQSTIHFDGTGINVFDLKHEIITQNQLGEGMDFDLKLYHSEQPDLEYDQDQDVIPRSSFVLAKRLPAASKTGKFGNASRYVSGKPRINRKAINNANLTSTTTTVTNQVPIDENMSEEDKIKMMFENQSNAWAQTQDELSHHKVIYSKPNQANPEDAPPPGYICYRCGGKDHWIKNCPAAEGEGRKLRKTTGIPRSYLKTITKEAGDLEGFETNDEGELIDKQGNKYMITDTGEYVIAMADSKTWKTYQEKQQNAAMKAKKEFESKIIEVINKDGKTQFLNPLSSQPELLRYGDDDTIVKLPCCDDKSKLSKLKNFYYNKDELEQLLIDNDFHCPNCDTENNFIDNLIEDEDLKNEIKEYVESKSSELGLEDPNKKRPLTEEGESGDTKRQNVDQMPFMMPFFMQGMPMMPNMMMPPK